MKKLLLAIAVAAFTVGAYAGADCAGKEKAACASKEKAACAGKEEAAAKCPASKEAAKKPVESPKASQAKK